MQISGTPQDDEIINAEFEGRMLNINEPSAGKVLSFIDSDQHYF